MNTSPEIAAWVSDIAKLTTPDRVVWCDGSDDEWRALTSLLVKKETFVRLPQKSNSFWCASDPGDVARVEDRTFVCSEHQTDAGPTNNWMDPADMKAVLTDHFHGAMSGRTMYVIAFCMGPLDASDPKFGVQITDSEYVAVSMQIMMRSGTPVWERVRPETEFVKCLHSVGAPLYRGQTDVPWPCNDTKYIAHFPEERMIWSYGSGFADNSFRIASKIAKGEGWLAEHMLILKLTSPAQKVHYIAAAFPSSCGKTTLGMLEPALDGWTAETIGDNTAWLRFGTDGRLYAINPEAGFYGIAPGTGARTNPHAMAAIELGNTIFTNVALTDNGDVWWEGMTDSAPSHLTDWQGRDWSPNSGVLAAHPNSRYCTPIAQWPTVAPEWDDPQGVPLSAIFFGGRRAATIPLIAESLNWQHGVFLASTLSSEATAAADGAAGIIRRDPMAMLPYLGYHVGDYFQHWLDIGKNARQDTLPKIFYVNWFRRGDSGEYLWPGFGENIRILKWALQRLEGTAAAEHSPVGNIPTLESLDLNGLDCFEFDDARIAAALRVDPNEWAAETQLIDDWFATIGGNKLPDELREELVALKARIAAARRVAVS